MPSSPESSIDVPARNIPGQPPVKALVIGSAAMLSPCPSQPTSAVAVSEYDLNKMSATDLIRCITERVSDPVVRSMLRALYDKIPKELLDCVEAEKRSRRIVMWGVGIVRS
ncbi:unnamed protein product [Nippostrongylus brasiliensis]|uniref:Annexin n=1 Tax=Nippostrongylus brasiliensis TaxID=27835 RepID=A0A0N4Y853_NIPBR|nr:unnamed protein product [Nippostrongylus brasiliensis]